jgi:hypothetical protein
MSKILLNTGPSPAGWHPLERALRCPRLFAYGYLDLPMGRRHALVRGSLAHVGQAHFWRRLQAEQQGEDPEKWYEPLEAIHLAGKELHADEGLVNDMVRATDEYIALTGKPRRSKVVMVEEVIEAKIAGHRYTARADLILEDSQGRKTWIDHKSSSSFGKRAASRYTLSGQIIGLQVLGAALWKDAFGGVKINLLGVAETPLKVELFSVEPAPAAYMNFAKVVDTAHRRIASVKAALGEPGDPEKINEIPMVLSEQACVTPYGPCEAWAYCQFGIGVGIEKAELGVR